VPHAITAEFVLGSYHQLFQTEKTFPIARSDWARPAWRFGGRYTSKNARVPIQLLTEI